MTDDERRASPRLGEDELDPAELAELERVEQPAPAGRRLPRLTALLTVALVGALFFFAGVQVQKRAGGSPGSAPGAPPPATPAPGPVAPGAAPPATGQPSTAGQSTAPGEGITRGEITAIRGEDLYVRELDGTTVKLRTTRASQVLRVGPIDVRELRPGQVIDARSRRLRGADVMATSVTVLPPPQARPLR